MQIFNKSSGEAIADIPREEFKHLRITSDGQAADIPQDRVRTVPALLTIHTPVLPGTAKWKFVYEGKQISASIKDQQFLDNVSNGEEAFRNGDRLSVELDIGEKFVAAISDFERSNQYVVAKVHEHIPRPPSPKQLTLTPETD